jgi:SAM-dependent methyltransferase/Tfp pilus assembly protein PilF
VNRKERRAARKQGGAPSSAPPGRLSDDARFADADFNIAVALMQQGRLDEAVVHYRRLLARDPDFAEACSNLGVVLATQGRLDEAASQYRRALALKPGLVDVHRNLMRVLMRQGAIDEALATGRSALAIAETDEIKALFVQCVRAMPAAALSGDLRDLIARALSEGWSRPSELSAFATELIRLNGPVGAAIARATAAQDPRDRNGLEAAAGDRLLRALLESAPVRDVDLERFLTAARDALLERVDTDAAIGADVLAFACALARQCFINEYVFAQAGDAVERSLQLRAAIDQRLASSQEVAPLRLAVVAMFHPLHSLAQAPSLLGMPWPRPVEALIDQQLRQVAEEQAMRASIPALTPIDDAVSLAVQRQYEDMPYPRWVKAAVVGAPAAIDWYLRSQFPSAPMHNPPTRAGVDVLIAGCGTGQHAIETARRFAGARVVAIDLSVASLGYAQRMTRALGVTNIDYAQADILHLGTIGRSFDLIEAGGVLHHMRDWAEGWRTLAGLLRPGGFMHVALYSALAREDIRAARAFIAERRYGHTADDIRRCRQELLQREDGSPLKNVSKYADFFTTSECRDLLFHVQEHQLTIPAIQQFLRDNRLIFIGFTGAVAEAYRSRFPNDHAMTNLDQWHAFETENPMSFVGMYQFWVQKPAIL